MSTNTNIKFTEEIVKGIKYTNMLPEGFALVLEGGGTRGFYSAGVFEAFMNEGIMFPYIIGVSAGAANALSYIAGQRGRNRIIVEKYVGDSRYLSYRNLLRHRTMFGYDFIFNTIPEKHIYFDREVFLNAGSRFLTGATECSTGQTVWFEKQESAQNFDIIRASCSVPVLSKIVKYKGYELLDGGTSTPIPIEKSIADGNKFHVVVLTRNKGYKKSPFKNKFILQLVYGKYPKLCETILNRHNIYNKQLELCEQLEKEGKALIIRPSEPLTVDRYGRDTEKLLALYDEGQREGAVALRKIL